MRLSIDSAVCQGHGLCVATEPTLFGMNAREHGEVLVPVVPPQLADAARQAMLACPEGAITIED